MLIVYSGMGHRSGNPEVALKDAANVMLTFNDMQKNMHKRFRKILKVRLKRKKEGKHAGAKTQNK